MSEMFTFGEYAFWEFTQWLVLAFILASIIYLRGGSHD